MDWSRTLRIDASLTDAERDNVADALERGGVTVRFGPRSAIARTYALVEGPADTEPQTLAAHLPQGRLGEPIIVLAIEPTPADALPLLESALGGNGAPVGIAACEVLANRLVVEIRPHVTSAVLVLRIADVEIRRFGGFRRVESLAPLSSDSAASVAASGLHAPDITSGRILEALLERSRVE